VFERLLKTGEQEIEDGEKSASSLPANVPAKTLVLIGRGDVGKARSTG